MRNSDPIIWPGNEVDEFMRRDMKSNYDDSINILQTQWAQADIDQRFCLGDQELWSTLFPNTTSFQRKMFNFNLINNSVQMVGGYQRQHRKVSICIPVHNELQKTADQFTKCLYYINGQGAYQVYSDAFQQGAITQGIGFISLYLDYSEDPSSPEIKKRYVDFKSVLVDPFFRKKDLSDCRFIWTRQFFDKHEASMLYPHFEDEIMRLPRGSYQDERFYYMPEVYQIQQQNLLALDEYWYQSTREVDYLVDTYTNEVQEFVGDEEDLRLIFLKFGRERFKVTKKPKQTVRRAIVVNDRVLADEENPYGIDCYPYVPVLGYFTPDTPYYAYKYRGIVRDMRDAQYLFNRRKVTDLDILESQQQGIKLKKGSLVTPKDGLNQGNGRMLVLKETAQMTDVEPMPIIPPAASMLQMEEMLKDVMRNISGINEELLGSAVDDKAGILSVLRQGAGLVTLQTLFDHMDYAQQLCDDITVRMIQKNWSYNKVAQVIGEEPTAEFDNKAFFKYGCKVVQGHLTETQQQLELAQILDLQERFGPIFPMEEVVQSMTIQNKDRIIEKMMENRKAQAEQEQQMAQLQMQQLEVDNATKLSYAQAQEGLATERIARVQTDRAVAEDKLRRAQEEEAKSILDLAKAVKELQGLDMATINAKIAMLQQINDLNFTERMIEEKTPGGEAIIAEQQENLL